MRDGDDTRLTSSHGMSGEHREEELIEDLEAPAESQRDVQGGLPCNNVSCHKTSCPAPSVLV
jgi:hypothetical protein